MDSDVDIVMMFVPVFRDLQKRFTWRKIDGKGMIVLDILVLKRSFILRYYLEDFIYILFLISH